MASVHHRKKSPYWFAAFYLPDGRRTFRSTKQRKRGKAMEIAIAWSNASQLARDQRLTEVQARRVIGDIHAIATRETMTQYTAAAFIRAWLDAKLPSIAERSAPAYQKVTDEFIKHLGRRAEIPVEAITVKDVLSFRSALASRVSAGTINQKLLIMRGCWSWGGRLSLVTENPWKAVEMVTGEKQERRAFTLPELRSLLDVCDSEWRSMVMLGLYTGQRLDDLANLTWRQVDFDKKELSLLTRKTKRRQIIPLSNVLVKHLLTIPSSDNPDAPIMLRCAENAGNTLSRQFGELLTRAGLIQRATTHRKRGAGRGARRVQSELSFHSLRHTATTLLKSTGASNAIAGEIIGHDSAAISRGYTHIETDTLRKAVDAMPDILAKPAAPPASPNSRR